MGFKVFISFFFQKSFENGYEGINLSGKSKHSSTRGPRPSDVIDLPQQADSIERHSQQNEMVCQVYQHKLAQNFQNYTFKCISNFTVSPRLLLS